MKRIIILVMTLVMALSMALPAAASTTVVLGHQGNDNVEYVVGTYKSMYTYDANGDYYWDLGDGRIYKTVDSIDDLDQDTVTECKYQVIYRGDFGDDPFLDDGWTINNIRCKGYDDTYTVQYRTDWFDTFPQF